MRRTTDLAPSEPSDPTIAHHYLFILIVEVMVLSGLAWLAANYR